jgi:hypothetical protein
MASIKIDILKELASEMNTLRAEVESVTAAAAAADNALGQMARHAQTMGNTARAIQAVPNEPMILDQAGRPINDRRAVPRYKDPSQVPAQAGIGINENAVSYNPFSFASQKDTMSAMLHGESRVSLQDIAQISLSKAQYESPEGQKRLQTLTESLGKGGDLQQLVGKELQQLSASFKEQADIVTRLTSELKNATGSEAELARKRQELIKATEKATQIREQLTSAEETAAKMGGPGGPGDGGFTPRGILERIRGMPGGMLASMGMGGLATAAGAALDVYRAGTVGYAADTFAHLRATQATGASEDIRLQRQMGIHDLTRGENVMRFFANYMSPDKQFDFLGTEGRGRAWEESQRITQRQLEVAEREKFSMLAGYGTGVLRAGAIGAGVGAGAIGLGTMLKVGALAGSAGGPLGAAIGAGIGAAGGALLAATSRLPGLEESWQQNLAAQKEGGVAGTFFGRMYYGEEASQLAENTRRVYGATQQLAEEQRVNALQQAELQRVDVQRQIIGYDAYRRGIEVKKQFVPALGRQSVSGFEELEKLSRQMFSIRQQADLEGVARSVEEATGFRPLQAPEGVQFPEGLTGAPSLRDTIAAKSPAFRALLGLQPAPEGVQLPSGLTGAPQQTQRMPGMTPLMALQPQQAILRAHRPEVDQAEFRLDEATERIISRASDRDMTISQFAVQQNMLSTALSTRATGDQAARLIDISRGGMGSTEQLTQNILGLQQVSGRQEDLKQLENILSTAVASGFDKAKFAQSFVQTVTELSAAVRTSDTNQMATTLAIVSQSMTQRGDLLGQALAQRGIQQVSDFTGQSGGFTGMMKAHAVFAAGGTIAGGAAQQAEMNIYQSTQAIDIINRMQKGEQLSDISQDPRITNAIRADINATARTQYGKEFSQLTKEEKDQVLQPVLSRFQASAGASLTAVRSVVNVFGGDRDGNKYTNFLESARSAVQQGDPERLKNIIAEVTALGQVEGMDAQGVTAAFMHDVTSGMDPAAMGLSAAQRKQIMGQAVESGRSTYKDEASIERQRFLNRMSVQAARDFNRAVTPGMLKDYFAPGIEGQELGFQVQDAQGQTQRRTLRSLADVQALEKDPEAMKAALNQLTVSTLMTGQMSAMAQAEGTERFIGGFDDYAINQLTGAISKALQDRNTPATVTPVTIDNTRRAE